MKKTIWRVSSCISRSNISNIALGQEFRLARGLEGAEAEKAVHALAESEIDKRRLQVRREALQRLLRSLQSIAIDHHAQQLRMPRLLHALQRYGLSHKRVRHHGRERRDDRTGTALGMIDFLPERHGAQPPKLCVVEFRPRQRGGIVEFVRLQELTAEQLLVSLGSDFDFHQCTPRAEAVEGATSACGVKSVESHARRPCGRHASGHALPPLASMSIGVRRCASPATGHPSMPRRRAVQPIRTAEEYPSPAGPSAASGCR